MRKFKPFAELIVEAGQVDGLHRIVNTSGEVIIAGGFRNAEDAHRLVDCWNACRKFHSPANHIETTEERVGKLEQLRKEAWARTVELGANDFRPSDELFNAPLWPV